MFKTKSQKEKTGLIEARERALSEMQLHRCESPEYAKIAAHVRMLTELINLEKPEKVSLDTLAIIVGNGLITLVIVVFETQNVVTTKALPFLIKIVPKNIRL